MSAKKSPKVSAPRKPKAGPSAPRPDNDTSKAMPAKGRKTAWDPRLDCDFRWLFESTAANADREMTAAGFYEYARECLRLRVLSRAWLRAFRNLKRKHGESWESVLSGDLPEEVESAPKGKRTRFERDAVVLEGCMTRIQYVSEAVKAGPFLLGLCIEPLAKNLSWREIPEETRKAILTKAWEGDPAEWPKWDRRGGQPLFPFGVAVHRRWNGQRPLIGSKDEARLWREEAGVEEFILRVEWGRNDQQIAAEVGRQLQKLRPKEWQDYRKAANSKTASVGLKEALENLAAHRLKECQFYKKRRPQCIAAWMSLYRQGRKPNEDHRDKHFLNAVDKFRKRLLTFTEAALRSKWRAD